MSDSKATWPGWAASRQTQSASSIGSKVHFVPSEPVTRGVGSAPAGGAETYFNPRTRQGRPQRETSIQALAVRMTEPAKLDAEAKADDAFDVEEEIDADGTQLAPPVSGREERFESVDLAVARGTPKTGVVEQDETPDPVQITLELAPKGWMSTLSNWWCCGCWCYHCSCNTIVDKHPFGNDSTSHLLHYLQKTLGDFGASFKSTISFAYGAEHFDLPEERVWVWYHYPDPKGGLVKYALIFEVVVDPSNGLFKHLKVRSTSWGKLLAQYQRIATHNWAGLTYKPPE